MLPKEPSSVSVSPCGSAHPGSEPSRTVIWVQGVHDIATRAHLSDTIARAASQRDVDIVIDLSGVTFMDASTIGAIVDSNNRLRARSRSLSVRAPSTQARRLLGLCDLAFLIEEQPSQVSPVATALGSWVDVPARDRSPDSTQPPAIQQTLSEEPTRPTVKRRGEPAGSVQQRPAPS